MLRGVLSKAACLALAASVGACASNRFEGPRERPRPQAALEPATPALPAGTVTSEPLAPPPGAAAAPSEPPPSVADAPAIVEAPPPPAPPPVVATGRSSVVGSWNATDAAGSCKVSLSSTPSLDLYKASTAGCGNKDLAKVSAWDFRDGEVYLYQPGGTVAARLRQAGGGLDGALSKSGAPLSLAR
ncbi:MULTISPECIES: AprI/Inh family metalloprotease inhibitor [unclassified Methylobacterium]|uniref:AprI/Inh family metalloprotease inhibitor n=1 Tax=unclassified Methylobacterium TaxID=2615210 RepID=UPI0036F8C018